LLAGRRDFLPQRHLIGQIFDLRAVAGFRCRRPQADSLQPLAIARVESGLGFLQ
jgi:hypothetical protein